MQIRSTIAFYNHKIPIIQKKNSHSVMVNHEKTTKYFPGLSRTYQQKSRTFKDFPGQQKKSRTFPKCGNPVYWRHAAQDQFYWQNENYMIKRWLKPYSTIPSLCRNGFNLFEFKPFATPHFKILEYQKRILWHWLFQTSVLEWIERLLLKQRLGSDSQSGQTKDYKIWYSQTLSCLTFSNKKKQHEASSMCDRDVVAWLDH